MHDVVIQKINSFWINDSSPGGSQLIWGNKFIILGTYH
jgi:hypothetical protein